MPDEQEINYFAHLQELRTRLIWVVVTIAAVTVLCFVYSEQLLEIVTAPVRKSVSNLYFLAPYEAFLMRLKVAVTCGIVLSSPIIFTQFWKFTAPGLYQSEKKAILPVASCSILLFVLGVVFAYFFVIPFALKFFLGFQTETLIPLISIDAYVSMFLSLVLIFGGMFVTPVILIGLIYFGILDVGALSRQRKVVVVIVFILAAILTPTMDIVTQCLLAVPLLGLFELSLLVGKGLRQKRDKQVK